MKRNASVRRDGLVLAGAVAGGVLMLGVIGHWLDGPAAVPELAPRPVQAWRATPSPYPDRMQAVSRDQLARARADALEPGAACRSMADRVRALGAGDPDGAEAAYRALCADADLPDGFAECVAGARAPDDVVDCAVALIPDSQRPLFERAIAALHPDLDLTDDAAYEAAIADILGELDDDQRDRVIAQIQRAVADTAEEEPWQP